MSLLTFPVKVARLWARSATLAKDMQQTRATWCFTDEGRRAYETADTTAKRIMYFYEYLASISRTPKNTAVLHKLAVIMAEAIDVEGSPYRGYPNVLKEDSNPLVAYVKGNVTDSDDRVCGIKLLCAFQGVSVEEAELFFEPKHCPYRRLTQRKENEAAWRIERSIIQSFFLTSKTDVFVGPFTYFITQSAMNDKKEAKA